MRTSTPTIRRDANLTSPLPKTGRRSPRWPTRLRGPRRRHPAGRLHPGLLVDAAAHQLGAGPARRAGFRGAGRGRDGLLRLSRRAGLRHGRDVSHLRGGAGVRGGGGLRGVRPAEDDRV